MFLKNKNIIFKIRRSKVTDYAALKHVYAFLPMMYWAICVCTDLSTLCENNKKIKEKNQQLLAFLKFMSLRNAAYEEVCILAFTSSY